MLGDFQAINTRTMQLKSSSARKMEEIGFGSVRGKRARVAGAHGAIPTNAEQNRRGGPGAARGRRRLRWSQPAWDTW